MAFAGAAGLAFWAAWHPKASFYSYNIPVAVPFAAFFLDRFGHRHRSGLVVDAAVLVLALLRVAAPPLPFASGHALFAGYAAATAYGWVLRATAAVVMLHVIYVKLFVTGGFWSLLAGLVTAMLATVLRRHFTRHA
jgi:hypothetical protein